MFYFSENIDEKEKLYQEIDKINESSGEDNIYVADQGNHRIRKISELSSAKGAKVETISGNGEYDYQDGTFEEAAFRRPSYVIYGAGALYVVDNDDNRIRKVQNTPKMITAET